MDGVKNLKLFLVLDGTLESHQKLEEGNDRSVA